MNYEEPEVLSPLVTRVLAENPTIMTGPGTNTYVIGTNPVLVLDVGPDDARHIGAVRRAVAGRRVAAVLCSHHHIDHAPGTVPFARSVDAPVLARFHPDGPQPQHEPADGELLGAGGVTLTALFTPGHASDHLCFLLHPEGALLSGDHIMSGSTVVISPPDGHMATYLDSLARLRTVSFRNIYPGHGPVIADGPATVEEYITHRGERREQVLAQLKAGDSTIAQMVEHIYVGINEKLLPVARFSVQAHLHQLRDEGLATTDSDPLNMDSDWSAT